MGFCQQLSDLKYFGTYGHKEPTKMWAWLLAHYWIDLRIAAITDPIAVVRMVTDSF